jgi:hypothetical protein
MADDFWSVNWEAAAQQLFHRAKEEAEIIGDDYILTQHLLLVAVAITPVEQHGNASSEVQDIMTWDEHFFLWSEARQRREDEAHSRLQAARKRVAQNAPEDWQWLLAGLDDPQKKWFVAQVFRFQPVPKQLRAAMLRTGVYERNPSLNRQFIEPCVRSYGSRWVKEEWLRYLESGTNAEKTGAASALYWSGGMPDGEDVDNLRQRIHSQLLREFVGNENLQVRQRIIPMLCLKADQYPKDLRPLVLQAIAIARSHSDEYIRHRVEIQLGAGGPLMAIPDTEGSGA